MRRETKCKVIGPSTHSMFHLQSSGRTPEAQLELRLRLVGLRPIEKFDDGRPDYHVVDKDMSRYISLMFRVLLSVPRHVLVVLLFHLPSL